MMFDNLPDDVLLHVFSFMGFRDLISLRLVNNKCKEIASVDSTWKRLCEQTWLVDKQEESTWLQTFGKYFRQYGKYVNDYARIKDAWNKMEIHLRIHSSPIYNSLQDGLSEADLDSFSREYDVELPAALRLFYRIHGGQNYKEYHGPPGLFGSLDCTVFGLTSYHYVNPLKEKVVGWHRFHKGTDLVVEEAVENEMYCTLRLCRSGLSEICITLPKKGHKIPKSPDSFPAFSIIINYLRRSSFQQAIAPSFEQWFLSHVERTISGCYPMYIDNILGYYYDPKCVSRTGKITVTAGWAPSHMSYDYQNMLFEYRITMKMDEDASSDDSCQLENRHWYITHFCDGKKKEVHGRGVVGEYPIMRPGVSYSWTSRTSFLPPGGSMRGHFTMRYLNNHNKTIEVECPEVIMKTWSCS